MRSFGWESFWAVFVETLTQLCPNIREIWVHFSLTLAGNVNHGPQSQFGNGIEPLDPAFERDALAGLEDVLFKLSITFRYELDESSQFHRVDNVPITRAQVENAIQVKLPKLHKRGIARVEYNCSIEQFKHRVSIGHRLCRFFPRHQDRADGFALLQGFQPAALRRVPRSMPRNSFPHDGISLPSLR